MIEYNLSIEKGELQNKNLTQMYTFFDTYLNIILCILGDIFYSWPRGKENTFIYHVNFQNYIIKSICFYVK